ncbi:ANK [Aspergillus sp. HF37]|nr:ANK [Aspergillus sp. HF37]
MANTISLHLNLNLNLHIATMLDNADRVTALLRLGADPHAKNAAGSSVLDMADFLHKTEIAKRLLRHLHPQLAAAANPNANPGAAVAGTAAVAPGAGIGAVELLNAIRTNRPTLVRALLDLGVRETQLARDPGFFRGVLLLACCVAGGGVVEVLVKYGPGVSVVQNEGVLVQVAAAAGNIEVVAAVKALVEIEREREKKTQARLANASSSAVVLAKDRTSSDSSAGGHGRSAGSSFGQSSESAVGGHANASF